MIDDKTSAAMGVTPTAPDDPTGREVAACGAPRGDEMCGKLLLLAARAPKGRIGKCAVILVIDNRDAG